MTDKEFELLMKRCTEGDKTALHDVYNAYLSYIYSIVYNVLKNKEDAEDITSEFFIRLWNNSDKYKPGTGHRGYIATIARNMSIDFLRKHSKEQLVDDFNTHYDDEDAGGAYGLDAKAISSTDNVEEEVVNDMTLKQALETLDDAQREIVGMKIMGDLTFKEISEILNIPMGTVTWRYREAINKLRRCGYEES